MVTLECYHGTSYKNAESILRDNCFRPNRDNEKLRLGVGVYFFCKGYDEKYAITCARELQYFHYLEDIKKKRWITDNKQYAILSCVVECPENEYFDMYNPAALETFHNMRYDLHAERLKRNPESKYEDAADADTQVMNILRKIAGIKVVRCPQFFGMFPRESRIELKGRRYPKTFVPNVTLVCADPEGAIIRDIRIVEKGVWSDESTGAI